MSIPEESSSFDLEAKFTTAVGEFDYFVREVAEVVTIDDFRDSKKLIDAKLRNLYKNHELADEAVVFLPESDAEATIVDYSTGNRYKFQGPVMGYMTKFYPITRTFDVSRIYALESVEDLLDAPVVEDSSWRNGKNPISLDLGVRLRPVFVPDGLDLDLTYIEVPAEKIGAVYEDDLHPLLPEVDIFNAACNQVLAQDFGRVKNPEELEEEISFIASRLSVESELTGGKMLLSLYPETDYFLIDDLGSVRAFFSNDDSSDQNYPEVRCTTSEMGFEAQVMHFDWLWDYQDPDEEDRSPLLFATLKLADEAAETYGAKIVTIPVNGIQFGINQSPNSVIDSPSEVFAYELSLFHQVRTELAQLRRSQGEVDTAVGKLLTHLNEPDTLPYKFSLDTLGSHIKLTMTGHQELDVIMNVGNTDTETTVTIFEGHKISGRIAEYIIHNYVEGKTLSLRLICELDVSEDRYFAALGIHTVCIPVEDVDTVAFTTNIQLN